MKFVKVKGFEKKVAFLGVFYMCVFGESNLTVYNKCLEDLFQQKLFTSACCDGYARGAIAVVSSSSKV